MYSRKITDVIKGFTVAVVVGATYLACNIVNGNGSRNGVLDFEELVSIKGTQVNADTSMAYPFLNFDSAKGFISSLQSLLNIEGYETLTKNTIFTDNNEVLAYTYSSNDNTLLVTTNTDDEITCCRFYNIEDEYKEQIKKMMQSELNKTKYRYKDIYSGFILEPKLF